MTSRLEDDDILAMLEDRASRVSPDAAREAMAGARAVVRGPSAGSGGFALLPVALGGAGSRLPIGIAAVAMVAVLVVALAGGRLGGTPAATAGASAVVPVATAAASGPAASLETHVRAIEVERLRLALANGELDGRVIIVTGRLVASAGTCPFGATEPCHVEMDGVPGVAVAPSSRLDSSEAWGPIVADPAVRQFALRVAGRDSLVLVGRLDAYPAEAPTSGLSVVSAWLGERSSWASCPDEAIPAPASEAPCRTATSALLSAVDPALSPDPTASEAIQAEVEVAPDSGIPAGSSVIHGRFLVQSQVGPVHFGSGFVIVAMIDADAPRFVILGGPETAADELRARIGDGSLDGRVLVVDGQLESMQIPCRDPGACSVLALHGLEGIVVMDDRRPAGVVPGPRPERGAWVLRAADGTLHLLGSAPASLDDQLTVKQLALSNALVPDTAPIIAVSGWLVTGGPSQPWLTDDKPAGDGSSTSDIGVQVTLATPLAGGPLAIPVTEGPFLVRRLPAWEVVAVLGSTPAVRATLP